MKKYIMTAANIVQKKLVYIRQHKAIFFFGTALTILVMLPVWSYPYLAKDTYQGINIAPYGSDAHFYLTRAKEIADGHGLGNPVLREGKDGLDPFFIYGEKLLIAPLRVLGITEKVSVVSIYHTYNAIAVFLIILLIYCLSLFFSPDKRLAVMTSIFAVGGYHIVYNKTLFYFDANIYGRAMIPYLASLVFFLYLNVLFRAVRQSKFWRILLAGLCFGLIFYIYFFAWSFALALNGVLGLIYILTKKKKKLYSLLKVTGIGLVTASFAIVRLAQFYGSDAGAQVSYFNWASHGHDFIMSKIGLAMLLLFGFYIFVRHRRQQEKDPNSLIIISLIITGWVSLNQQLVTGLYNQPAHYYWYYIVPISIILGLYMVWSLFQKPFVKTFFYIFVLGIVFVHALVGQYQSTMAMSSERQYEQRFRPIIDELLNDEERAVILAGDRTKEFLIPIYTKHDLFWEGHATMGNIPAERFTDVLYMYAYLNKESRTDFEGYLQAVLEDDMTENIYERVYQNLEGLSSGYDFYEYNNLTVIRDETILAFRDQTLSALAKTFDEDIVKNDGIHDLFEKYHIDYILWDKIEYPEWDLSFIDEKEEKVVSEGVILYKLL